MTRGEAGARASAARLVWVATVVAALALVALIRVPTHLGVKVEEANRTAAFNTGLQDYRGSEYLWRVWWRARGDFVDVNPSWLLGLALIVGLAVFVVGVFAAYRIALSVPSDAAPRDV